MIRTDIIERFSDSGFLINQEAVVMIQESELPLAVVDEVLRNVDESVLVVAPSNVNTAKELLNSRKKNVKPMLLFEHNEGDISDVIVQNQFLSLIHISEPTRRTPISYAVFCLKKKKTLIHNYKT